MRSYAWFFLLAALGTGAASPALSAASMTCPSEDFDTFLTAFMNNVKMQQVFTNRPLESISINASAEPEPATVSQLVDGAALHFPVMPSAGKQRADGLSRHISAISKSERKVTLVKSDTDYQLTFFFRKTTCWQLYRMRDDSL
ncbi:MULTISPECIES: hypothetical protein [unclassified Rhizobium]|jgi:hypothetical protein|uniref:hypothetical protein n=1 Tax=unclassified Rhizobium TaxID=2613769 RepID=UPI0006465D7D|nr:MULTISPECIES: hypothetical protein [unclassified Rhizobium]OJY77688.1 MAG: hypothetical protein BGP09_29025 [Rhizobium sp. 60-20]RKD35632.1 hypothetical protein BJ928_13721 [Rhizobium sp. WW_1]